MNIIVLGPQASGKGTQASLLAKKLGLQYLELGSILRERVKEKTALSQEIDRIMNQKGVLVPDKIVKQITSEWIDKYGIKKGIVFDGPPRNIDQYRDIEEILAKRGTKINKVIYLKVSRETSIKRISSRRVCPKCDIEYNLITKPSQKDELCDRCQKKLIQRRDDTPEVVDKRLATYHKLTEPLIEHARQQGILEEVDGERPIEIIHQEIVNRLDIKK